MSQLNKLCDTFFERYTYYSYNALFEDPAISDNNYVIKATDAKLITKLVQYSAQSLKIKSLADLYHPLLFSF